MTSLSLTLILLLHVPYLHGITLTSSPDQVKSPGDSVRISCQVSGYALTDYGTSWIQHSPAKAMQWIGIMWGSGSITSANSFKSRFSISRDNSSNVLYLDISSLQTEDSAVYYCARRSLGLFGSGTRVYVTDESLREPEVSVYSTTKSQQGRNTFLCHARNMFPDMVKFHWKVLKDGNWANMEKSEGEVLELNFSDKTRTSMMIIDEQKALANHYACSYTHETSNDGKESKLLEIKKVSETHTQPSPITSSVAITCLPANCTAVSKPLKPDEYSGAAHSLNLATWMYTLMIFKSVVYFCAVSYFMCRKNVGSKHSATEKPCLCSWS